MDGYFPQGRLKLSDERSLLVSVALHIHKAMLIMKGLLK